MTWELNAVPLHRLQSPQWHKTLFNEDEMRWKTREIIIRTLKAGSASMNTVDPPQRQRPWWGMMFLKFWDCSVPLWGIAGKVDVFIPCWYKIYFALIRNMKSRQWFVSRALVSANWPTSCDFSYGFHSSWYWLLIIEHAFPDYCGCGFQH